MFSTFMGLERSTNCQRPEIEIDYSARFLKLQYGYYKLKKEVLRYKKAIVAVQRQAASGL